MKKYLKWLIAIVIIIILALGAKFAVDEFNQMQNETVQIQSDYTSTISELSLKWEAVDKADGYEIFMLVDGVYIKVATVEEAGATEYTLKNLRSNTEYSIKIQPYYTFFSVTFSGALSEEIQAITAIDKQSITSYESTQRQITINWTQNEQASGYKIYMKSDGNYEDLAVVESNDILTYTAKNLNADTEYSFKVKAYYQNAAETIWADASDALTAKTLSDKVVIDSYSTTVSTIKLTWDEIISADGYEIYAKTGDSYESIKTITSNITTGYTISDLTADTDYIFRICAFYNDEDEIILGEASDDFEAKTLSDKVVIKSSTDSINSIEINWNEIVGVDGYRVYMKINGKFTSVETINSSSTCSYKATGLILEQEYSFKVKAFYRIGDEVVWADSSEVYTTQTAMPKFETFSDLWVTPAAEVVTPEAKTIFLTFDDGPSELTLEILDMLKEYNIKATFFVCAQVPSQRTDEAIAILNRIIDEGHEIGIHSYSHDYADIYSSVDAFLTDFEKLFNFIQDNTGYTPTVYRFPGGSNTSKNAAIREEIMAELQARGFVYYDWNCANQDATGVEYTSEELADFAISSLKQNSYTIVLMHDFSTKVNTPESARLIIEYALENSYTFDVLTNDIKPIQFIIN